VPVTNALFVCSANRLRSPTAEAVFATWPGVETDSAGLDNRAVVQLSTEQIEWADIIFVMEAVHRRKLGERFGAELRGKRVVVLGIPDDFRFMQAELVELLVARAGRYLR
jgi:predicted protein tyrosine phosphatase